MNYGTGFAIDDLAHYDALVATIFEITILPLLNPMGSNRIPIHRLREGHVTGLLGLAFDAADGHKRITRGKDFLLAGGSEETHGLMRETIIKVNERLDQRGQELADISTEELRDLIDDVQS